MGRFGQMEILMRTRERACLPVCLRVCLTVCHGMLLCHVLYTDFILVPMSTLTSFVMYLSARVHFLPVIFSRYHFSFADFFYGLYVSYKVCMLTKSSTGTA
eukprot:768527-Hanusia_phi.AAC.4